VVDRASSIRTLPASDYHDPAVHVVERDVIFGREWLCLGPTAAPSDPSGVTPPLVGWADLVPQEGGDRVATATWRGLRFATVDPGAPNIEAWLGDEFVDRCAAFPVETWAAGPRLVHELACNWKTYTDNYLEGYHIPFVHPALARAIDVSSYVVEVHDGWVAHSAQARDGSVATGAWLYHWPNLALNFYEHGMSVERWFPTGPRTCALVLDFLFADTGHEAMVRNRLDVEASARICVEDRVICELVQRNLESSAFDEGWLAPEHESALADFHRRVRRARGSGPLASRTGAQPVV